jgi:hypothetical protein
MADAAALAYVKEAMHIGGEWHDAALSQCIDEAVAFLKGAGVRPDIAESPAAYGVVACGVVDMWNYGAGERRLSEYFVQRAVQLASEPRQGAGA